MPLTLGWGEIAVRLGLSLLAGAVIGLNRSERLRPAGLRTTILVTLAASIAMIETNILLPTAGKPPTSFIVLDLMRLPLGILSGIGFIGAGAILRRGDVVEGVTTAATIWFVTVMGLCFGGGQIALGLVAFGIAVVVLWGLKWVEYRIGKPRRASLTVAFDRECRIESRIEAALAREAIEIAARSRLIRERDAGCEVSYQLRWRDHGRAGAAPSFPDELARESGVRRIEWRQAPAD